MGLALIKEEYKTCSVKACGQLNPQPISSFHNNRSMKSGKSNQCIICHNESQKVWREKKKLREPDWANEKARRLRKKWKEEDPYKVWKLKRNNVLKYTYGISLDDYNAMFVSQNGCCDICERPASDFPKKLVVDHCHETGKVRKLLCGLCNQMLGSAKENIKTLQKAIKYLENHNGIG